MTDFVAPALSTEHDVVIVGGGPGGAACALALRRRGLSVALLERAAGDARGERSAAPELAGRGPSPGESLSAAGQFPLRELGLWDALLREQHRPSYLTQSSWGSAELRDRHAIEHKLGPDLHVDRARFDACSR